MEAAHISQTPCVSHSITFGPFLPTGALHAQTSVQQPQATNLYTHLPTVQAKFIKSKLGGKKILMIVNMQVSHYHTFLFLVTGRNFRQIDLEDKPNLKSIYFSAEQQVKLRLQCSGKTSVHTLMHE